MPRPLRLAALALALLPAPLALPSAAAAQVATVDEGSLTVTRGGRKIGREEFRIVRQPAGSSVEYVARALAAYGDRRIAPALQTDAHGAPLRYQVEIRSAGGVEERLTGQADGPRFRSQARTARGEAAREYMVAGSTLLLDDELYHQLYFLSLGSRTNGSEVAVLMPRRNVYGPARVTRAGQEAVVVSGRSIPASRYVLALPGGSSREVWLDEAGRVLKVAVPDEAIVAVRDDPPA